MSNLALLYPFNLKVYRRKLYKIGKEQIRTWFHHCLKLLIMTHKYCLTVIMNKLFTS